MSSVDYKKLGDAGGTKAMMRHSYTDERLKHNHSNADINKDLTHTNTVLGHAQTYRQACLLYDARIAQLDATTNRNRRKDRQTCFSLLITRPGDLPVDKVDAWMNDVYTILEQTMGADNVIGAIVHKDEVHTYREHGQEKTSREHMHAFVVPEIDGQLNGRAFSSRRNMVNLNKLIEDMTRERYGIAFMTGEKARKKTVEQLKAESAQEEYEHILGEYHELEIKTQQLEQRKTVLESIIEKLQQVIDDLLEKIQQLLEQVAGLEKDLKKKKRKKREQEAEDLDEWLH